MDLSQGLVLVQTLSSNRGLNWVVRTFTDMEKAFTNVERVFQYTAMASEGEPGARTQGMAGDAGAAEEGLGGKGAGAGRGAGGASALTSARVPEDPPPGWPRPGGSLEFRAVVLRYAPDLDPALRGLSLTVGPLERLGIAGRTGAGKSSIIAALFRLVELTSGSIKLDGVDLARLARTLPSKLRRFCATLPARCGRIHVAAGRAFVMC